MDEEIIQEEEAIAEERAHEAARLSAVILNQPIAELPTLRPPICVTRDTTVRASVAEMTRDRVGCVLVVDGERLVGVFTERDVLTRIVDANVDVGTAVVGDYMTADPETLDPDDRVSFALNKMSVGGFRHVPLVDDNDRPVGLVAMRNVIDCVVDLFRQEVLNLPPTSRRVSREREGA